MVSTLGQIQLSGISSEEVCRIIESKLPEILEAMRLSQPEQKETSPYLRNDFRLLHVMGDNGFNYFFEIGKNRQASFKKMQLGIASDFYTERYLDIHMEYEGQEEGQELGILDVRAQHPTPEMEAIAKTILEALGAVK